MSYINFIYLLVVLFIQFLLCLNLSRLFGKINILKLLTFSFMTFIVEYLFISSALLFFNVFHVKLVLVITFIINLSLILLNFKDIKRSISNIDFDFRKDLLIILILLMILPFVSLKSQSISTGFDAGIYGLKSIGLMYGENKSSTTLKEYNLVKGKAREELILLQKQQVGLYNKYIDDYTYEYEYHALPTWPALMALWGKMLNISGMAQVLTYLFLASGLCLFYILQNIHAEKYSQRLILISLLFLPVGIYLAKNSLSETLFLSILLFSLLLMTETNGKLKLFSGVSLGLLGFIHLIMLPYFPAVFGLILLTGIISKKGEYFKINYIFCVLYTVSIVYSFRVSMMYTKFQFINMFGESLSTENILFIIIIILLFLLLIQLFIHYLLIKNQNHLIDGINIIFQKYSDTFIKLVIFVLFIITIYQGYKLGYTEKYIYGDGSWNARINYANKGLLSIPYLNIFSIIMATSYFSLPVIIYKIFNKKVEFNNIEKLICMFFLYTILVNTLIKVDTPKNYYSSRYFYTFVIPFTFILVGLLIKSKQGAIIACTIAIITGLPFNLVMLNSVEYDGNFSILKDTISLVKKDSIVLCDPDSIYLNRLLVTNLRTINNDLVFNSDSIDEISNILKDKEIYYISQSSINNERFDKILEKKYIISSEIAGTWIYPLKHKTSSTNLFIYKVSNKKTVINMDAEDYRFITGFNGMEKNKNDGFSWCSDKSTFRLIFMPAKTTKIRVSYFALPAYVFTKKKKINVTFTIDQYVILSKDITAKTNKTGYFDLVIPKELIENKWETKITIKCDTWVPKNFGTGSTDARKLGIAITKIEVVEK